MIPRRRLYPLVAGGGILGAAVAAVIDLVAPAPRLDVLNLTLSEYAAAQGGGVMGVTMALLGGAALALVAGLRAVGAPVWGAPGRLMSLWGGGMLVAAAGTYVGGPHAAVVHRGASLVALVSLPAAAGLLVPGLSADDRWRPVARAVEWLALAGGFGLLALTYVALPGERVMIGLVERSLLGVEVALLAVLTVRLVWLTQPWVARVAASPIVAKMIDGRRSVMIFPVLSSRRS
ncbi:DUF998 domain-containing protein [Thermostaphylospora chromogena]|nr:DUF998 domain-containing protein [Thermostaphylospora chromogena]